MTSKSSARPASLLPRRTRLIDLEGSSHGFKGFGRQYNVVHGAICDLFQRVDRVLAGKKHAEMSVTPAPDGLEAPSATDGATIMISKDALTGAVTGGGIGMMIAYGLNYHELAHTLYTPAFNASTRHWLDSRPNRMMAANILEDQRIEHMLRQVYPKMTLYFLAAVYKYFYDVTPRQAQENFFAYAAIAERRYVPRPERLRLRTIMVDTIGEQATQEVERITGAYVRHVNISSADFYNVHQKKLIDDLVDLMEKYAPPSSGLQITLTLCKDDSCRDGHSGKKKTPSGEIEAYEEIEGDDHESLAGETDSGETGQEDGEKPGKTPKVQKGDSGPEPGPQDTYDISAGKRGTKTQQQKAPGYSRSGSGEIVRTLTKELSTNLEVQRDLALVERAIQTAEFRLQPLPDELHNAEQLEPWMRRAREDFVRELRQLQSQVDPGWERETPSGRLNVGRVMSADAGDTLADPAIMFDEWQEDLSDALSIEAKILCDISGSMSGRELQLASQALWVICSSLDFLDAKIDPMAFDERTFQIWPQGRKQNLSTYELLEACGGTNPRVGIAKSAYDFADSSATHKLFLIYSDGSWNSRADEEDIEKMKKMGVTTVMVQVGHGYDDFDRSRRAYAHNCEHFFNVTSAKDIADIASKLTLALLKNSVATLRR